MSIGLTTFRVGDSSTNNTSQGGQVAKKGTATILTIPGPVTAFSDYFTHRLNFLDSHHVQSPVSQPVFAQVSVTTPQYGNSLSWTINYKRAQLKLDVTPTRALSNATYGSLDMTTKKQFFYPSNRGG